ncbi:hypothetical protein MtrunA17_Chr7g0216091 [Medicago truncatula]|uniref:Uncharacterized protein n=1 Tax=Medicago truncatula TaxID=3880 RepID=A0A396GUP3_MEDTR|nr:hypothetical protein MtrunA17_Chr7g0216091 [Medicago truncatula]
MPLLSYVGHRTFKQIKRDRRSGFTAPCCSFNIVVVVAVTKSRVLERCESERDVGESTRYKLGRDDNMAELNDNDGEAAET